MQSSVDDLNRTRMDRTRMMLQHAISLMSRPMARRHYELPPFGPAPLTPPSDMRPRIEIGWGTTLDGRHVGIDGNIEEQYRRKALAECKRNDRAERRARDRARDEASRAVMREFGPSFGRYLIRSARRACVPIAEAVDAARWYERSGPDVIR